jgi:enamine deaminase RidA (YjgF/YER057c/UK114 family)
LTEGNAARSLINSKSSNCRNDLKLVSNLIYSCSFLVSACNSSISDAVHSALLSLLSNLEREGFSQSDVFFVQLYLHDLNDFQSANAAYVKVLPLKNSPSRVCIQLSQTSRVSVDCLAYRGSRSVLHVQSISRWAPACIGPYSQCSTIGSINFPAGQIGLDPPYMKLPDSSELQIRHSVQNITAVLNVQHSSLDRSLFTVVFLSSAAVERPEFLSQLYAHLRSLFPSSILSHCCFLVCPALPRGSDIELQVISPQSFIDREFQVKREKRVLEELKTQFPGVLSVSSTYSAEQFLSVLLVSDDCQFTSTIQCIAAAIKKAGLAASNLWVTRIFASSELILQQISLLEQVMTNELKLSRPPAISLLPVESLCLGLEDSICLSKNVYILHLIVWDFLQ